MGECADKNSRVLAALRAWDSIATGLEDEDCLRAYVQELLAFTKVRISVGADSSTDELLASVSPLLVMLDTALDPDGDSVMKLTFNKRRRGPKPRKRVDFVTLRTAFDKAAADLENGDSYEARLTEVCAETGLSRTEASEWLADRRERRRWALHELNREREAIYGK